MLNFLNGVSTVLGALQGRKFALNGELYTYDEFKRYYPHNFSEMWRDAVPEHERRLHEGIPHDAGWFYRYYQIGSLPEYDHKKWRLGHPKYGWATAPLPGTERREFGVHVHDNGKIKIGSETERRRANDGKLYSYEEFKTFYGSDAINRWVKAEKESVNLLKSSSPVPTLREERRRANEGNYYTCSEFQKFYGSDGIDRWVKAADSRESSNRHISPVRHIPIHTPVRVLSPVRSPIHHTRLSSPIHVPHVSHVSYTPSYTPSLSYGGQKKFALNGELYSFHEFERHYGSYDALSMWADAIPDYERRLHEGVPHDAGWFYRYYNIGSLPEYDHKKWRKGEPKYGWATAARPGTESKQIGVTVNPYTGSIGVGVHTERRKANDGSSYSKEEFKLHYGSSWEWRWNNATRT